jgi:penicillin-binding protein 2
MESTAKEPNINIAWILRAILILTMVVLLARLAELQIIKGKYYRDLAEQNRIRRITILAPRGKILARGGEVLVGNEEVKRAIVYDKVEGYKKSDDLKGSRGDEILTEWKRVYPLGAEFAHVSGYLGKVNQDEVGKVDPKSLDKGPRKIDSDIGRGGLEEYYDYQLRGINGEELIEVDSKGEKVRVLGKRDPLPGQNVKTTIDYGLQDFVSRQLQGKKGGIIVSDANGEILALYSSPSFDPLIFMDSNDQGKVGQVLNDAACPLFNRIIGGTYHPGSTFKPIVAIAGLEEGTIDKDYIYNDTGRITINTPYGNYSYSNWFLTQSGGVEGKINLVRALARSTDTFFYNLGGMIGIDKLAQWANKFGLSDLTGIDLPGEVKGLVPTPDWKESSKGEKWFLGNTYHMSIGQGDLSITPIELNSAISAIAVGGKLCQPTLIGDVKCKNLPISSENIDLIKSGMISACQSGGTGFPFFDFEDKSTSHIKVACKTGTAETTNINKTHAWFTAFAPADFPEIVATVLVEEGGEGSTVAGPIERKIFDYWFTQKN